ncbi:phospholipase A [Formosa sp. PL04]|uniref:phospholipase A n=1 Tax=Formosa sp. PL04 TaxID=3081755 RepID=UPI002980B9C5|nr:phospholipase A [Formosa sp. PL04]MDW5288548.1 phospholipase A [Formosa sp. PL04]
MKKNSLFITLFLIVAQFYGQTYTREEVNTYYKEDPTFTIHKDNYIITGVPTNTTINSETADIKYQISFKQLVSRKALPWDTHLYLTYTQKAFWNIYEFSSPFEDLNFNPSVGLSKVVYDKEDRVKGLASLMLNHNSNGRDSIYSRSWNSLNVKYSTAVSPKSLLSIEVWAPFLYEEANPGLLDYIGLGEITFSHDIKPDKLSYEIAIKKGLQWNWNGSVRSRLYYNPFKSKNQYFMLEWFVGYAESLLDYNMFTSMVRVGFVIKTNELDFLKPRVK